MEGLPDMHSSLSTDKRIVPCCCENCPDVGSEWLEINQAIKSGFYCSKCATDLKWHGVAVMKTERVSSSNGKAGGQKEQILEG
jgi:hypothetical protein